jgi:hypothetical protein
MMFYWLDSFTHCLLRFFHHGIGSNPASYTVFNILRQFNQMDRRANRLARHSQQTGMT